MSDNPAFSAEFFVANRRNLLKVVKSAEPIVITANGQLQKSADMAYKFKQDNNFWYLTGIEDPECILVIDQGREFLIAPKQTKIQIIFEGEFDHKSMRQISGISEVLNNKAGWDRLKKILSRSKCLGTLKATPSYVAGQSMFTNPARRRLIEKINRHNKNIKINDLRSILSDLRSIKSRPELAAIQKAIDQTAKVFDAVAGNLQNYKYEQDIEAHFTSYFIKNSLEHGYDPIVASGINAVTLHYQKNNKLIEKNQCLLIDVGASWRGYSADITRTYCQQPSKRLQQVHAAVLEVQKFAMTNLKSGVFLKEYEKKVHSFMAEKLKELGLINDKKSLRDFYPHGTSHFLGLDTHDVGDPTKPLRPGMVLTVEPGIYIEDEAIGVRIEDDVLIKENSIEVLSRNLSRSLK